MNKKSAFTLLEIMIVIVLIGIIGTVVGVNIKGSIDKGRAFHTKQCMHQIEDVLMIQMMNGWNLQATVEFAPMDPELIQVLKDSGLVKNPEKMLRDGWGDPFSITFAEGQFSVQSRNWREGEEPQAKKKPSSYKAKK